MKIILCEDLANVGIAGAVKEVSDGYARNFLFPKRLALLAAPSNLRKWESEKLVRQARAARGLDSAKALGASLENFTIELSVRSGREGHLFGSVTSAMIADSLLEKGISIDKKNINLETPIKSLGEYQVPIRLHSQVTALLKVRVAAANSEKGASPVLSSVSSSSPTP